MRCLQRIGHAVCLLVHESLRYIKDHHKEMIINRFGLHSATPSEQFHALMYPLRSQSVIAWLECVVLGLLLFSPCEQNVIRRHFKHSFISVDTLMTYMEKLTEVVEAKVKKILPERFAVVLDCWAGSNTHYVAIRATFSVEDPCGYNSVLLGVAPIGDEDFQSAVEHFMFLKLVLSVYSRTLEQVVELLHNNATTNHAFYGTGPLCRMAQA